MLNRIKNNKIIIASFVINILLAIAITITSIHYVKQKRKASKYNEPLLWLAAGEVMNELLKPRRINVTINANLKNVKNKNDLILLYNNNIVSFKNKMKDLEQISIKKRKVGLSDLEWKLVFFPVLLNQNYEYGATSAYLHLNKEKMLESLPHIKSLHCGNLGTAVYALVANIAEDFNLQSISYPGHGIYFYANKEVGLLLDPTFNIYGIVDKSEMAVSPLKTVNKITDFVFLENKNNTNTGFTWHDDMNKFQASVLYYLGGAKINSTAERVSEIQGLSSDEEAKPSYWASLKKYNAERVRKINY